MSDGIRIEGDGLLGLEERYARMAAALTDLRLFWPLVIPLYGRWMGEQFDSGGQFFGEQWQPLSESYAAWKSQAYPGRGILMAEGDLRHAAQSPRRNATPTFLELTIEPFEKQRGPSAGRMIDPGWFQSGTDSMPARPLLPITGELTNASAQAELGEAANFYVTDTARRLGLL